MTDDTDIMARLLEYYKRPSAKPLIDRHMGYVGLSVSAPISAVAPTHYYRSFADQSAAFSAFSLRQHTVKFPKAKDTSMYIYLIEQRGPVGYDENEHFVVAALNSKRARRAVADAFVTGMSGAEGVATWLNTKKSKVTRLGFYRPSRPGKAYFAQASVVLTRSFCAG